MRSIQTGVLLLIILITSAITTLLPDACSADDMVMADYVLSDFTESGWNIKTLKGGFGKSTISDGVLRCDFSGQPGYVGIGDAFEQIPGKPLSVTLTFDGDTSGHPVVIRFVDSGGQYFQRVVATLDTEGTRSVKVPVNDMSAWYHFGGKDDGIARLPIKPVEIIIDHNGNDARVRLLALTVQTQIPVEEGISLRIADRRHMAADDILTVEARSFLPKAVDAVYTWVITDFFGKTTDSGHEHFAIVPEKAVQRTMKVSRNGANLCDFRLDAEVPLADLADGAPRPLKKRTGSATITGPATVRITRRVPTSVVGMEHGGSAKLLADSPFGMGIYLGQRWPSPEQKIPAQIAQDMGVKWMRDEFNWGSVEPEKGKWNWERFDHSVDTATQHGISVFGLLCYWAPWAKPHTEEGINDYCNYVRAVVGRYKDRIKYWEIWNEPNIGFWTGTTEQYATLMKAAYDAVKQADPSAKVIGCCTAGTDLKFIEKVLECGGYDKMDIVSIHPYRYPATPEETDLLGELRRTDALIRKYGPPKDIWLTEIGWPTNFGGNGSSEVKQAAMIARTYMQAMASGVVGKTFWYNFRNDGLDTLYNEHNFGIIRRDHSLKPACLSYRAMTRNLEGKRFVKALDAGPGVCAYVFEGQGRRTLAAWTNSGTAHLTISGHATGCEDVLGAPVKFVRTGDSAVLEISESPVYVQGVNVDVIVKADSANSFQSGMPGVPPITITSSPLGRSQFAVDIVPVRPLKDTAKVTVRLPGYIDTFVLPAEGPAHREVYTIPPSFSLSSDKGALVTVAVDTGVEIIANRSKVYYVRCRQMPDDVKVDTASSTLYTGTPIRIGGAGHTQTLDPGNWTGPTDLSATVWTAWDDRTFFLHAEVEDDSFQQTHAGSDIWQGDSLQLAIDPLHLGGRTPETVYEIGMALTPVGPQLFSWLAPSGRRTGPLENAKIDIRRKGTLTTYDAAIPLAELAPLKPAIGETVGFALVLNDDDGRGREGWLEWNTGVAMEKIPELYGDLTFVR